MLNFAGVFTRVCTSQVVLFGISSINSYYKHVFFFPRRVVVAHSGTLGSEKTFVEFDQNQGWMLEISERLMTNERHWHWNVTLSIQVCPEKGINPSILLWGWDWDHQTYSRKGYGSLGLCSSWWLNQPLWKICSSKGVHLTQGSGENKK